VSSLTAFKLWVILSELSMPSHPANPEVQSLVLWKSDVAAAYHQMPMHPLWQLKQVVNIDGRFSINRCNNLVGALLKKYGGLSFPCAVDCCFQAKFTRP